MKSKLWTGVSIVALGIAGSVGACANHVTNELLKGSYGYTFRGSIGQQGLAVGHGTMRFDGNGGVTGTEMIHLFPLGTATRTYTGTVSVNTDGTGSLKVTYASPDPETTPEATANFSFVAVNAQKELRFIQTDPGFIISGIAAPDEPSAEGAPKGSYLYTLEGALSGGGALVGFGKLKVGEGNTISGSETVHAFPSGVTSRSYEGTLTPGSDGMSTLKVTYLDADGAPTGSATFSVFVVRALKELQFVQLDPGIMVNGIAKVE